MPSTFEQQQIITHDDSKHAVVVAVAGSGKSYTMVERVGFLIEAKRYDPAQLLAVMFNRSASVEMAERLNKRVGKRNSPDSVTYHKLGTMTLARLMRADIAPKWEFNANPNRARYFAAKVIEKACKSYGFSYPTIVADVFLGFVDRVKGDLLSPEQVFSAGDWGEKYEWFIKYFDVYEKERKKAQLRFFSDLIYDPLVILDNNAKARDLIAGRYKHIIVDEYQDICEAQQSLIRYTAGPIGDDQARVMVVGDDDQTIYSWRGAKPAYILRDFELDFPGAVKYQLTRTWRYGDALSCAANYVIRNNTDRADKLCISGPGAPQTELKLEYTGKGGTEQQLVIEAIHKERLRGVSLNNIAILVRAYSRSGQVQLALLANSIPFRLEGGEKASVLDNQWVTCMLRWLSLAAGRIAYRPYSGEPDAGSIFELRDMLNVPALGLSFDGSKALCASVLKDPIDGGGFDAFTRTLAVSDGNLSSRIRQRKKLWNSVRALSVKAKSLSAHSLLVELYENLRFDEAIKSTYSKEADADDQKELIKAFLEYSKSHGDESIIHFLAHIDDLRSFSDKAKSETDAVHMTSIHRSKGLEWDYVIMIGLIQGKFPLKGRSQSVFDDSWPAHLEDERRLFYVGMTRARKGLYLMSPECGTLRKWHGSGRSGFPEGLPYDGNQPSQFLFETNLSLSSMLPSIMRRGLNGPVHDPTAINLYLDAVNSKHRVQQTG